MNLLRTSLLAMVFMLTMASCSKDEDPVVEELNYTVDLSLVNETDWVMAGEMLSLVNKHRTAIGLAELQADRSMATALAVDHTFYMIEQDRISHDNFQSRRQTLKNDGANIVGENVASGYETAQGVVDAWLNSPAHRAIIEGPYSHAGFGVIQDDRGRFYFTQLFYQK